MEKFITAIVACILFSHSWGQEPYQNYMRVLEYTPIEHIIQSSTADGGTILATLQNGKCGVTRLDEGGIVLWAKVMEYPPTITINNVFTVAEIENGPAFYLLASSSPIPSACQRAGYILTEVDDEHDVVFSKYYCHYYGSCGGSTLQHHAAEAHRLETGEYFLSQPRNPNTSCLYGLDAGGDTLYCRLYAEYYDSGGEYAGTESLLLNDGSILLLNRTDGGIHLMRVALDGEIIWSKTYHTGSPYDEATAAIQAGNDSIVVAGIHGISMLEYWGYILKMDMLGNVGWHRRFDIGDQDELRSGYPTEMTISSTGEIIVHLGLYGSSYLARFSPQGFILSVDKFFDENILYSEYYNYRSFWPKFTANDRLILAASVEYPGAPYYSDSIMVAGVNELHDLNCGLSSIDFFEEPFPTIMDVTDNGFHRGDIWFRTGEIPVQITDQDWIIEPFCLSTSIAGTANDVVMWLQPTLVAQGSAIELNSSKNIDGDLIILDIHGRTIAKTGRLNGQQRVIDTATLTAGIYSVVLNTAAGQAHVGRFMVTNE